MGEHRDYTVDITSTCARKVQAVRAHASQFGKHPDVEGFLRCLGQRAGAALAEAFKRLTP
jgi:LmbE family N-acetylglucosaminyl deacetylase